MTESTVNIHSRLCCGAECHRLSKRPFLPKLSFKTAWSELRSHYYSAIIPLYEQLRVGQEGGGSIHRLRVFAPRVPLSPR